MLNKAQVIGHIGKDPKITTTQGGYTIANFSVATTERGYTSKDGKQIPDRTEWHNVVCYGKLAEVVKNYMNKGAKVYVEEKCEHGGTMTATAFHVLLWRYTPTR